ncbi:MAG: hypothetical protein J1E31_01035 [Helicobacter sp.]|nr:hypothetical protein [Helicobacter sp.]
MIAHNKPSLSSLYFGVLYLLFLTLETHEIPILKQNQIYSLYNQNYQNYKEKFNKGLNFRIFTKDKPESEISDIMKGKNPQRLLYFKVPKDKETKPQRLKSLRASCLGK